MTKSKQNSAPHDDEQKCRRLLVGMGDDTYDPECALRLGHGGPCRPDDCPTCDGSGRLSTGAYHPETGWSPDACPTCGVYA